MERATHGTRRFWIVLLSLVTACHSYRPTPTALDGRHIRMRFASERDVVVTLPKGDTIMADNIVAIEGKVTSIRGDTVDVRVSGLRNNAGYLPLRLYRGGRTTIVHGPQSTLELRAFSGSKTGVAFLTGGLVALSIAAVVFVIGMSGMDS
jgi:hypothetical protein